MPVMRINNASCRADRLATDPGIKELLLGPCRATVSLWALVHDRDRRIMPQVYKASAKASPQAPAKSKKRKAPWWTKLFVAIGAVLMVISGGGLLGAKLVLNEVSDVVQQENLLGDAGQKGGNTIDGPVNLLLVGLDQRE